MNLFPHERSLLYLSYLKVAAAGPELTILFYNRLFEIDPSLRDLFKVAMVDQGVKWRMMLNIIIAAIDHPERLKAALRDLGRRHLDYGVKDEDYAIFSDAVLWAVQQYLGSEYTPEVDAAWRKLFAIIVENATGNS